MKNNDTRSLIIVLYVLMVLFLGAMYIQGEIMNDPETFANVKTLQYATPDYQVMQLATTFHISGEATIMTITALTVLFGFGMIVSRSKSHY